MFSYLRNHIPKRIPEGDERRSAVMIPLIQRDQTYHILFEVRASHLNTPARRDLFPWRKGGTRRDFIRSCDPGNTGRTSPRSIHVKLYGPLDYFFSRDISASIHSSEN
jgi:hypothetical protein